MAGEQRNGGILMDVPSNQIIARGLSMPHSPRWYDGRLWLLESGAGTIGTVDPASGQYRPIAELPGYTRGLSFHGPLAFVGLSQVRESAVFSGIPLVERLQDRTCGVWVVNIHTGETVAFVKFEDAVQEIFAVEVLPNMQYPDVITDNKELLARSFVLPDDALADVPERYALGSSCRVKNSHIQHRELHPRWRNQPCSLSEVSQAAGTSISSRPVTDAV